MRYVQLFTGCVVLILSAEIMVHEPVILSTRMGILPLVIGMATCRRLVCARVGGFCRCEFGKGQGSCFHPA